MPVRKKTSKKAGVPNSGSKHQLIGISFVFLGAALLIPALWSIFTYGPADYQVVATTTSGHCWENETGIIYGQTAIGPMCPAGELAADPVGCADFPTSARLRIQGATGGQVIELIPDLAGQFSLELPTGTYTIEPQVTRTLHAARQEVLILPGQSHAVYIRYESGIE